MIAGYLSNMPALRYLVFVVKSYLARVQLGSAGTAGLSSYSTILLIVNYLQVCLHAFFYYPYSNVLLE